MLTYNHECFILGIVIENQQNQGGVIVTDTMELELAIKRRGLTKREIAKRLKLSGMGLHKKINSVTEFKASEIAKMQEILGISSNERDKIFFADAVDYKSQKWGSKQ